MSYNKEHYLFNFFYKIEKNKMKILLPFYFQKVWHNIDNFVYLHTNEPFIQA